MGWAREQVQLQIREIAERAASSEGLEVVDVELRGGPRNGVVRVFIDRRGGVTHADCETVSRQMGPMLDVEDLMPGAYRLEVSSPGLDRKLVTAADYKRVEGRKARIKLRRPQEGRKQFTGLLQGCNESVVMLDSEGEVICLRLEDIESARLVVEF